MDIINWVSNYGPWAWIVAGLAILALELVAPGGILFWLGVAGVLTGVLSAVLPMSGPWQFLVFGILALASIFLWLRFRPRDTVTDRPYLNRRADNLIGREAVLEEPVTSGYGRVILDDTIWRVTGPDLAAGQRIRVAGNDGAVLRIEPV